MLAGWLINGAPTIRNYCIEQFDVNPDAISFDAAVAWLHQSAGFGLQEAAVAWPADHFSGRLESESITDHSA